MPDFANISQSYDDSSEPSVLVVDDDPDVRTLLQLTCIAAGYTTDVATDGVQALAWLRACRGVCVVVLDYHMPQLDGWGVLSAIAADPTLDGAGHAYILLTADAAILPQGFLEMLAAMSVTVAAKPIDVRRLHDLLADAVARIRRDEQSGGDGGGGATAT